MSEHEQSVATDEADVSSDDATASEEAATPDPEEPDSDDAVVPDEDLVDRVEAADSEAIAREIATLREQLDTAREEAESNAAEAEELASKLTRKQADFQNFKKRMERKQAEQAKLATEDLVTRLLDVRDNLDRALDTEGDIREGVEVTVRQFDDVFDAEGVERIAPAPGEDVDPNRHEVLMRVESDQPGGTVHEVYRPGYEMGEKVIRAAQVTVSDE